MKEYTYDVLDLDKADKWCRDLYYDRLKTLDLKGKRVLEVGFDTGLVTERLIRDKDYYQYASFDSVDLIEACVTSCKERMPEHNFIHADINSKTIDNFLNYDIYLTFYTYVSVYGSEIGEVINKLITQYNKEVVLYESLVDDFNYQTNVTYNSMTWEIYWRLHTDTFRRMSNQIYYEKYFKPEYKNGFIYIHPKTSK